jgi:hypothetical protein
MRTASIGGAIVAAISAAILTYLGSRQFIGYDSVWHVFIARQQTWANFWHEVQDNAHPPLYYLLLKGAIAVLGDSFLAYRAWSIAGVAVSTFLIAKISFQVSKNPLLSIAAAAAFGWSLSAIDVGLEVRSYAVFLACMLAAFSAYLDWLGEEPDRPSPRARTQFAFAMSVAFVTHYSAFFFFAAAVATPALLFLGNQRWRARLQRELLQRRLATVAMFGVPLAVFLATYLIHARRYVNGLPHVSVFMRDPHAESRLAFVVRGTGNLVSLFAPNLGARGLAAAICVSLLVAGGLLATLRRSERDSLAQVPFLLLAVMTLTNIVMALAGRYPYGGEARHEIFLFPFAVLCLFAGAECARRALPASWSSSTAWASAAGLGVAASAWLGISNLPLVPELPEWRAHHERFSGHFPAPPAVLVDQFNSIALFAHYHDWRWNLRWQGEPRGMWQVWDVSRKDQHFAVCRGREWQSDFSRPELYDEVVDCLAQAAVDRVAVFRPQQQGVTPTWKIDQAPALAVELAAAAGLGPTALFVDGEDVYASFQPAGRIDPSLRISIVEATYGRNCQAPAGNATTLVQKSCDGLALCRFRVESPVLGDPAPRCAKDFGVAWMCSGEKSARRATLAAEAGFGSTLLLSCAR